MAVVKGKVTIKPNGSVTVFWEGLTGADTASPVDISHWPDRTVGVMGTFGGTTITIQGSMNDSDYATLKDNAGAALSFTTAGIRFIVENPFYIKPVVTGGTGVDIDVIISAKGS